MGRGKLGLNLISSHKTRSATFHKRKKSLFKKAYELSTLCDVRTCVLVHGPAPPQYDGPSAAEFHTWPPNRDEIEGMIRAYKTNCGSTKCSDLFDFFSDRKKKVETKRSKLRSNADEIKYPKWDERLDCLSKDQLRLFMDGLSSKIEAAEGMIDFMEADYDHLLDGGASTIDYIAPPSENSTPDSQWLSFHQLQAQEIPQILVDNSVPRMPIEEFDPSNSLFGLDEAEFTQEHLQSLLNELDNDMTTFHSEVPLPSVMPVSTQVHDHQLDYSDFDFEYTMMMAASNFYWS